MKKTNKLLLLCTLILLTPTMNQGNQPLLLSDATQKPMSREARAKHAEHEKTIFQWFRTISEVIHLISERHYKDINFPDFIQNALKGALPTTDPHSAFFSQKSYKAAIESTSGKFSGIGVSILNKAPEDNSLVIIDVIQGGPSDRSGLRGGDKIVEVDGESLKGLSSDEVISKLRGKVGTSVNLKVIREKKPLEFKIKREIIKDQSLTCYHFKQPNTHYISLKIFAENTPKLTARILKKINNKTNGVILDLRRNPGGILDSAVDMAGLFLPKKSLVVSTKSKDQKIIASYKTNSNPIFNKKTPVFILIDNFTASASEILAGALRHYSDKDPNGLQVFLVGTKSFGKGSVQEVIPISNGCALKITTQLYYLPNDISTQANGIEPDFIIKPRATPTKEMKWVEELYGQETSLRDHITQEEAQGKQPKKKEKKKYKEETKEEMAKNWEQRYTKSLSQDAQVHSCINMINMLKIVRDTSPKLVDSRKKSLEFLQKHFVTDNEIALEKVALK